MASRRTFVVISNMAAVGGVCPFGVVTVLDNLGEYGFDLEIAKEELIETIENC